MRVLALCLLFASAPALAGRVDGNELYEFCTSSNPVFKGFCAGYIVSIVDQGWMPPFDCTPPNATSQQLVDITTEHLRKHPELRTDDAQALVAEALVIAFPCR